MAKSPAKKRPYDAMKDESSRAITAMPYTEKKAKTPPPKKRTYDPVKDEPTSRPFKKGGYADGGKADASKASSPKKKKLGLEIFSPLAMAMKSKDGLAAFSPAAMVQKHGPEILSPAAMLMRRRRRRGEPPMAANSQASAPPPPPQQIIYPSDEEGRAGPSPAAGASGGMKRGGKVKPKAYAKGGKVSSRGDGIARKGKTKGRYI